MLRHDFQAQGHVRLEVPATRIMNSSGKLIKTGVGFQTNPTKNDIAVDFIDTHVEFAIFSSTPQGEEG